MASQPKYKIPHKNLFLKNLVYTYEFHKLSLKIYVKKKIKNKTKEHLFPLQALALLQIKHSTDCSRMLAEIGF